jgi:hypothetical protein
MYAGHCRILADPVGFCNTCNLNIIICCTELVFILCCLFINCQISALQCTLRVNCRQCSAIKKCTVQDYEKLINLIFVFKGKYSKNSEQFLALVALILALICAFVGMFSQSHIVLLVSLLE